MCRRRVLFQGSGNSSIHYLYQWNIILKKISFTSLTGIKMAMYCFGSGDDVTNSKLKRSLYSDASKHVWPFEIFDKELASKGLEAQARRLITSDS